MNLIQKINIKDSLIIDIGQKMEKIIDDRREL